MNINITCPINQLGYGIASLNIVKSLINRGHNVALFPIGMGEVPADEAHIVEKAIERNGFYDKYGHSVRIWHQHDMAMHVGKGLRCGFPIFELDRFTDKEKHQLSCLDRIFVPSGWAAKVVNHQIPDVPVIIVPLGVDRTIFHENLTVVRSYIDHTVFFNCGKWEKRKGHDVLIEAFNKAFTEDDKVRLIMHCHNPFLSAAENSDWELKYTKSKLGKAGKVFVKTLRCSSQQEVAMYMNTVDCGVFPSRAEGWNLEIPEMMSMGKPVIATEYSGHTEYCTADNSFLIKVDKLELANDGKWFKEEGQWAKFGHNQMEQLIYHLRQVHKNQRERGIMFNLAGINTAKSLSWNNTAKRLEEALC
jgi:glycosyltransferase involved in cell wall biosynthesis